MGAEEHTALDCLVRRSSEATRTAALFAAAEAAASWSAWTAAVVARICARSTHLLSNQRDVEGNTPLMVAVQNNNFEVARLILLLRPDLCDLRSRNNVSLLTPIYSISLNSLSLSLKLTHYNQLIVIS